jgi:periplasmic protein TonB
MPKSTAGPGVGEVAGKVLRTGALEEKPIWSGLYESVRDALFPLRLPPLDLTSTPIPVIDRMAVKTNPWAVGSSTIVNAGILALLILLGLKVATNHFPRPLPAGQIDLGQWPLPALAKGNHSGSSGGSHDLVDPIQGRPPKVELNPLAPPQVAIIERPQLAVDPAITAPPIEIPYNTSMRNLGVLKSGNVTVDSNGPGDRTGMGWRGSGGVGPGDGPGYGPGSDPGVYVPGRGGVTAPAPIVAPEAEFSDEARRAKYQGICLVALIVDAHGLPQNVHVVRRLGMGLDEKALEAIRKYRFKPATKDGKPVAVGITVEVDFRLF